MEDSSCSRTCDKSGSVSGCVAYELFRHLACPLIIGDVAEDEPAKRDQVDQTNSTFNGSVTEADLWLQTVDLRLEIQQRNGPICDRQLGEMVCVWCGNHFEAACVRFGGGMYGNTLVGQVIGPSPPQLLGEPF